MRITAETKEVTRQHILDAARELLCTDGWERTTTRAMASKAGIAAGTLFNYFESKEALAVELAAEALTGARAGYEATRGEGSSLAEDLFGFIWTGLRALRPYRAFIAPALQAVLGPLVRSGAVAGDRLRADHLQEVEQIVAAHGRLEALSPVLTQLYWTLYFGVLAHWTADESPNQEDTLALLDQSLHLFCAALDHQAGNSKPQEDQDEPR